MLNFYVASCTANAPAVDALASRLLALGLTDTFRWTRHLRHGCSSQTCGVDGREGLAAVELRAASMTDLFVGLDRLGRGCHVELGAALAGDPKTIVLVGVDVAASVFYQDRRVKVVGTVEEAIELVRSELGRAMTGRTREVSA